MLTATRLRAVKHAQHDEGQETIWDPTTATRNRLGSMLPTTRLNVVVDCDEATSRQRNERVIT